MQNKKFILVTGDEIYPGYLDKENREKMKIRFGKTRGYMKCACNLDRNLFYRISDDLKIYPEHNNYQHEKSCSRYRDENGKNERKTAYIVNDEDGEVTAYLSFNPKTFSMTDEVLDKEEDNEVPEETTEEELEELVIEKDDNQVTTNEKKEPKLALKDLIRSINTDTYTERILNNRVIDSRESFSKSVFYRMKMVRISKMRKAIGDLTLEKDGVKFIYLPFVEAVEKTVNDMKKCYVTTQAPNGERYSNFIFPRTLEKALKEYRKVYDQEPDENTMIAGFQYLKKGKGKKGYRVLGRIHLFQVSDLGLYCRNEAEHNAFNNICNITKADHNIRFWIPPEDNDISGIIQINGYKKKILLLARNKKTLHVSISSLSEFVPCVVGQDTVITADAFYSLLKS